MNKIVGLIIILVIAIAAGIILLIPSRKPNVPKKCIIPRSIVDEQLGSFYNIPEKPYLKSEDIQSEGLEKAGEKMAYVITAKQTNSSIPSFGEQFCFIKKQTGNVIPFLTAMELPGGLVKYVLNNDKKEIYKIMLPAEYKNQDCRSDVYIGVKKS